MFGSSSCSTSHVHFVCLLLALAVFHGVHANENVEFIVADIAQNTPGGKLLVDKIGVEHVKLLMSSITTGVWEFIFWQNPEDMPKKVQKISLYIDTATPMSKSIRVPPYAYEIHIGAEHIEKCKDSLNQEIHTLLSYEIAHILQNTGDGQIPPALKNGIAAYVVIKLSKEPLIVIRWKDGDLLEQLPAVVGQFLDYCATEYSGFVEKLNKKMELSYQDEYFVQLSDKTRHELWEDYKSKYINRA